MNSSAIALAMQQIYITQGHNEWKLCFLGGERGGYETRFKEQKERLI